MPTDPIPSPVTPETVLVLFDLDGDVRAFVEDVVANGGDVV